MDVRRGQINDCLYRRVHGFHGELYAAGHVLHAPEKLIYSPKELMEMDWLDECVDGALPHYDDLDVKTRTLVAINGLANLKKLE